jgi:tRNA(Ile)-lysidine synthase TilS/MesJ
LGHHFDDAVETFFLSLFYEGRLNCFAPVTYLDRTEITKIRPLLYVYERDIIGVARRLELPILASGCPADGYTRREQIKELLKTLGTDYKDIKKQVFSAIQRSDLKGWKKIPDFIEEKESASSETAGE